MNSRCASTPAGFVRVLLAASVIAVATAGAGESERWAILEAIHQLENPRNLARPGPGGELGAYQFRAATWRQHTTMPFEKALDREMSDIVAVRHYEWLKRGLERARVPVTPYTIALAWNSGLSATVKGTSPPAARDYAERAANLVVVIRGNARIAKSKQRSRRERAAARA